MWIPAVFSLAAREIVGFLMKQQQQHTCSMKNAKTAWNQWFWWFFASSCLSGGLVIWEHLQSENTINTMVFAIVECKSLQFFSGSFAATRTREWSKKTNFIRVFAWWKIFWPASTRPRVDCESTAVPLSPKIGSLADTNSRYQTISITGGLWVDSP